MPTSLCLSAFALDPMTLFISSPIARAIGVSLALLMTGAGAQTVAPTTGMAPSLERKRVDVDARIKVESRSVGSDGVTRTSVYEETLMRRGAKVWTQRVLPKSMGDHAHAGAGPSGHKHLNPFEGGRLIEPVTGQAQMTLVVPHDKVVVSIPQAEFANMGFDGSWERAYFMITERELRALPPSGRKSDAPTARWHERKGDVSESVLWDEALMLPRTIESSNREGSQWRRVTVTPAATLATQWPWLATQGFEQKIYADYLD